MKNAALIQGWMTHRELQCLYEWSRDHQNIVEVGSWKGRSTSALLQAKQDKWEATDEMPGWVFAVDTWWGSPSEIDDRHKEASEKDILQEFLANVGDSVWLHPMRMKSHVAAKAFVQPVDMVFIDASHDYEDVKLDLEVWGPKAKRLLCGHDWTWDGVRQAVTEYAQREGLTLNVLRETSLWFIEKEK